MRIGTRNGYSTARNMEVLYEQLRCSSTQIVCHNRQHQSCTRIIMTIQVFNAEKINKRRHHTVTRHHDTEHYSRQRCVNRLDSYYTTAICRNNLAYHDDNTGTRHIRESRVMCILRHWYDVTLRCHEYCVLYSESLVCTDTRTQTTAHTACFHTAEKPAHTRDKYHTKHRDNRTMKRSEGEPCTLAASPPAHKSMSIHTSIVQLYCILIIFRITE